MPYCVLLVTRAPDEITSDRWKMPLGKCTFCSGKEGQLVKEFRMYESGLRQTLEIFRVCKKCIAFTMKPADGAWEAKKTLTLREETMHLWKDQNEDELF